MVSIEPVLTETTTSILPIEQPRLVLVEKNCEVLYYKEHVTVINICLRLLVGYILIFSIVWSPLLRSLVFFPYSVLCCANIFLKILVNEVNMTGRGILK